MVKINEWLPNPIGKDSENEWIELYNDSNQSINLNNWSLISQNKIYKIKNLILEPKGFVVFKRSQSKLYLLNEDGELKLFDSFGNLVDAAKFWGQAPEGKSFSRFGDNFLFSEPTPGKQNLLSQTTQIITNYSEVNVFNKALYLKDFIFLDLLVSILLSFVFWFIIKNYAEIRELFFK